MLPLRVTVWRDRHVNPSLLEPFTRLLRNNRKQAGAPGTTVRESYHARIRQAS
jgi:macrodomain Ter protein organizer (MatP/YcbG family)